MYSKVFSSFAKGLLKGDAKKKERVERRRESLSILKVFQRGFCVKPLLFISLSPKISSAF
jgi:hypothetical protein